MTERDARHHRRDVERIDALFLLEAEQGRVYVRGLGPIVAEFAPDAAPHGQFSIDIEGDRVIRTMDLRRQPYPAYVRAALVKYRRATGQPLPYDDLPAPPNKPWSAPALIRSAPSRRGEPDMSATVDVDQILAALTRAPAEGTAARTWPGLVRAAEHMVLDVDAANAATPHGVIAPGNRVPSGWVEALAADRMARLVGRLPLVEVGSVVGAGIPMLPTFTTTPTAGAQGGQKQPAYSKAFQVSPDTAATLIDSTLMLNVSLQLEFVAAGIVDSFARLAVVAEAEEQIVAALEANATAAADIEAALATFTGLYAPSVIITPPGGLVDLAPLAPILTSSGIAVVIIPTATTTIVLDPAAVVGYLVQANLSSIEPSVVGRQYAEMIWGQLSVAGAGVAAVDTATPQS